MAGKRGLGRGLSALFGADREDESPMNEQGNESGQGTAAPETSALEAVQKEASIPQAADPGDMIPKTEPEILDAALPETAIQNETKPESDLPIDQALETEKHEDATLVISSPEDAAAAGSGENAPQGTMVVDSEDEGVDDAAAEPESGVVEMDIYRIEPDREQPRRDFDPEKLEELKNSIQQVGLLQPILVRKMGDYYQIIAGERRYRAARLAGLKTVPVIIRQLEEEDRMAVALIENLQRQDLNPMEEANAYQKLMSEHHLTQELMAEKLGRSRSAIANTLRFLNLPQAVQVSLSQGLLSAGHAKVLLSLDDASLQSRLALQVISDSLTVRELEDLVRKERSLLAAGKSRNVKKTGKSLACKLAEERMKELLNTKVSVTRGARKGSIEIEYYTDEDLDRIVAILEGGRKG